MLPRTIPIDLAYSLSCNGSGCTENVASPVHDADPFLDLDLDLDLNLELAFEFKLELEAFERCWFFWNSSSKLERKNWAVLFIIAVLGLGAKQWGTRQFSALLYL